MERRFVIWLHPSFYYVISLNKKYEKFYKNFIWNFTIITMADLNKVILCLQKIKSKNLGQN